MMKPDFQTGAPHCQRRETCEHCRNMTPRLLFAAFLLLVPPALNAASDATTLLKKIDEGFIAVFEKVAPAVVVIEAEKKDEQDKPDENDIGKYFRDDGGR